MAVRHFSRALKLLRHSIPGIAEHKNLQLTAEEVVMVARIVLANTHLAKIRDLANGKATAALAVAHAVTRMLDVLTLCREIYRRAAVAGRPEPDFEQVFSRAQEAIDRVVANDGEPVSIIWPDPTARERCAAVGVRFTSGTIRAMAVFGDAPHQHAPANGAAR